MKLLFTFLAFYLTITNSVSLKHDTNDEAGYRGFSNIRKFLSNLFSFKEDETLNARWLKETSEGMNARARETDGDKDGVDDNDGGDDMKAALRSRDELRQDRADAKEARQKAAVLHREKTKEADLDILDVPKMERENDKNPVIRYQMDHVFNVLRSGPNGRRSVFYQTLTTTTKGPLVSEEDSSSGVDAGNPDLQFKIQWHEKMRETAKIINKTGNFGDTVNMEAARPWDTWCGDPNQHDMPWGHCMLGSECEPELRIFRGDLYCGRTSFVCCNLEVSNYDLNLAMDPSLEYTSKETEEVESSSERHKRQRRERRDQREHSKHHIKSTIRKIVREINRILEERFENLTEAKSIQTELMRKLILKLKKAHLQDRLHVRDIQQDYVIKVDTELLKKILQLRELNRNFMSNETFANLVINRTMSKMEATKMFENYPDLKKYVLQGWETDVHKGRVHRDKNGQILYISQSKKVKKNPFFNRRSNAAGSDDKKDPEYLDYDTQYGFLYRLR